MGAVWEREGEQAQPLACDALRERQPYDSICRGIIPMLNWILERMFSRTSSQRGQGLVEYALIIALVAVVVIGTLILLGPQIVKIFQNVSGAL